ncbi:folate-binding protein YgfZ [Bordetella genomosp. 9]|uniref:CAF17-like 4Fe-4S cluster assembly/insertion protein YgfZ n=1 Tax=Bordetella genomosp. 9 TaxID=1416803 RepID=UPI000A291B92|nr:folate-binding protein YgfZ [Bordetella genomosp. 9]ARP90525.1 folate-binding protein YgfZ [Bordetella genomosp. 9]
MTDSHTALTPDSAGADAAPVTAGRAPAYCAVLPAFQVIAASGADAIEFLHGQLTQDVRGLAADSAALAGYCTAKGRLLATLVMWRPATEAPDRPDDADTPRLHALVRADVAEPLLKRLRMFVLRAKVKLAAAPLRVAGVWTQGDGAALEAAAGGALPRQPWRRAELASGAWIAAPAAQGLRWWWIATDAQIRAAEAALRPALSEGSPDAWLAADLAAGLPWVGTPTQDLFIPQTVNLDLIGGVSFTKGCYPGQEVVARSHYRGTVKRRMAYGIVAGRSGGDIPAGTDVFDATDPNEPCGRIVDAAGAGDTAVLFETTLSALSSGRLRLGSADGPAIDVRPLPYPLRQDQE